MPKKPDRKCGACTLCCTAVGVPELAKAPGEKCVHLTPTGCGIYEERPDSCRQFDCSWLKGLGDISVRPDRIGVVLGGTANARVNQVYTLKGQGERWHRSSHVRKEVKASLRHGHRVVVITGQELVEVKLK